MLDVLGLESAVEWLVSGFRHHHPIEERPRIDLPQLHIGEPGATVVFCLLQEALTNFGRDAQAEHVEIEILRGPQQRVLGICDDGCGFNTELPRRADALGLLRMRERALLVDGTLEIRSVPGNGTTVTLPIPCAALGNSPAV